ncbi:hypothetical protein QFZ38_003849 [Pseudomonas cedrina]|nr:hypothetical protein [Pseudomonas cedrina]
MAIRWSKGLWAGLLLGDAIYQINSVNYGSWLACDAHRYRHNFQRLTNLPVVSGLVPRWAAKPPQ